jgi:alkylation response protein AidB-like acyl-CoA dehydrogenase
MTSTVAASPDDPPAGPTDAGVSLEQFEAEARAFLDGAAPKRSDETFVWGHGSDNVGLFPERTPEQEVADVAAARAWAQTAFDAGFGWITGPPAYGGRGLSREHQRAFQNLASNYQLPSMAVYGIGLGMVAPTILVHATEEVRQAYLRRMYRGDIVGCQLFSEPSSGSDLASLQTKAERDGDEWIVNGQKVWTSGAHLSDIGEIICRTDPDQPKHRGLTGFVVDMHAPGVEVRPLRQMTGGATFNEVFFTDVRVPASNVVGEVNGGWRATMTTLANERSSGGGTSSFPQILQLARDCGATTDSLLRQRLANCFIKLEISRYLGFRIQTALSKGMSSPETSVAKLLFALTAKEAAELTISLQGPRGMLVGESAPGGGYWQQQFLSAPSFRIAAGSDEVQRNIIGERVLGLPR